MPEKQIPEEFKPIDSPSNSSLSSTSSDVILINANYVRNSRSTSVSSTSTNIRDDESIDSSANANNRNRRVGNNEEIEEEEESYQPIKLPSEPTLEELLVIKIIFLNFLINYFMFFSDKLQVEVKYQPSNK